MNWIAQVINNEEEQRFEISVDGHTAFAEYLFRKKDFVVYPHTVVPEAIGGQGIGEALATYAMDYALERGLKVKPYCPFIAKFMKNNLDQYSDLLADGFRLPS
ncbi:GNAT family N-acetyltransferase [Lewinella cohaerens]|uniref:GNAT family N-acetyltransferase n=1 Tax=Lewinella cohaerens TaxID=70995 RepID=UPI000369E354|nr:GNAT family N-acetyltransferase [Lewinella cohaerens]